MLIEKHDDCSMLAGYTTMGSSSLVNVIPATDVDVLIDNKDSSKYVNYNGSKLYNSAGLSYKGRTFFLWLLEEDSYVMMWLKIDSPQGTYTRGYTAHCTLTSGNTVYTSSISTSSTSTEITDEEKAKIPHNFEYTSPITVEDSDLNIFTDVDEFWKYVSKPYKEIVPVTANGGGATHIAKATGLLSSLSNNLSDILIVSGGGGGGMVIGDNIYPGADAGGVAGNGDNSANQSIGYAFGQGEDGSKTASAGGGGLYGGYKGNAV